MQATKIREKPSIKTIFLAPGHILAKQWVRGLLPLTPPPATANVLNMVVRKRFDCVPLDVDQPLPIIVLCRLDSLSLTLLLTLKT